MFTFFLPFFIFLAVLLEATVTTLPVVAVLLLCYGIAKKENAFIIAFVAGLLLDIFTLRPLGETSLFLLLFLFLVFLYQRKYEINSYPFVIVSSFLGAYVYLMLFGSTSVTKAMICSVIATVLFAGLSLKFKVQNSKSQFKV